MAGLGRKVFAAGDVLAAADVDGYLMDQTVMKFANTSAVSSAIGTALAEGMTFYLSDTDEQVMYDGTRFTRMASARNSIANGDFSKWSRGTTFTSATAGTYTADRWTFGYDNQPTTHTISKQAFTPGTAPVAGYESGSFYRSAVTTTGTATVIDHTTRIEDVRTFAGQTVTISFWAKADSTRTGLIYTNQVFGTGGSTTTMQTPTNFTATTSWQRFSFPGWVFPSISGQTVGTNSYISLSIRQVSANGSTLDIWGVQLEAGSVATPFRPAGGNSALDTVTAGSAGFDGVLVATNSANNPSGSGTPAWAGFDVAGKNKVINGGFDFWQRGTSVSSSAGSTYIADRFNYYRGSYASGGTMSQQSSGLTGFQYAGRLQRDSGNTSTSTLNIDYNMESSESRQLAGKPVTLSFYARAGANFSPTSSRIAAQVFTGTGIDQVLRGSVTGFSTVFSQDVTLTTSWQRFSVTGTVSSSATQVFVNFQMAPTGTAGAADYYEVTGVQLEVGSVATPFSRAGGTLQGELAACQRYYRRKTFPAYTPLAVGIGDGGTSSRLMIAFDSPMRTTPTSVEFSSLALSDWRTFTNNVTTLTMDYQSPEGCRLTGAASSTGTSGSTLFLVTTGASGYLGFSAEL